MEGRGKEGGEEKVRREGEDGRRGEGREVGGSESGEG